MSTREGAPGGEDGKDCARRVGARTGRSIGGGGKVGREQDESVARKNVQDRQDGLEESKFFVSQQGVDADCPCGKLGQRSEGFVVDRLFASFLDCRRSAGRRVANSTPPSNGGIWQRGETKHGQSLT